MTIQISWQDCGYVKIYSGHVTGTDMLASINTHAQDSRFRDTRYAINQFLDDCMLHFTEEEVARLEFIESKLEYAKRKIVLAYVTSDQRIIETLKKVFLVSPMIIYPNLEMAKSGISQLLRVQSDNTDYSQVNLAHYYAPSHDVISQA